MALIATDSKERRRALGAVFDPEDLIHIYINKWLSFSGVCPVLCSGHGVYGGGRCHCTDGWKGPECDVVENDCIDPTCNGRGKCRQGGCVCNRGWTGEFCQKSKNSFSGFGI